jgi:2-dehydropantoate 2-reductase
MDGKTKDRTRQIRKLFEDASVPVKIVDDIDSWLKYHVAFVNPIAGALLKAGDNYKLANDNDTIRMYIRAVKEGGRVLKALGYKKSYNVKLKLFYWFPEFILIKILQQVFNSKFAEVAMMMHANAARDEMVELGSEFRSLRDQTSLKTPNLDELIDCISVNLI